MGITETFNTFISGCFTGLCCVFCFFKFSSCPYIFQKGVQHTACVLSLLLLFAAFALFGPVHSALACLVIYTLMEFCYKYISLLSLLYVHHFVRFLIMSIWLGIFITLPVGLIRKKHHL